MRILLAGGAHPWELAASYGRAFTALGHEVDLFDWYGCQERWKARSTNSASMFLLQAAARRWAAVDLLARVRRTRPDLILLIKVDDLPSGAIRVARALAPGCRIAVFHPDDPFNSDRLRGPSHPRAVDQMRAVDHYFVWSSELVDRIARCGARDVRYLGFGSDPEFTHPIDIVEADRGRFGADLSFVGNWDRKREAWLAPLARRMGPSLAIWGGPDWKRKTQDGAVSASWRGDFAMGKDFARAVLCSRASINVLRPQNEMAENMRTYEIPACGGVMLSEWSSQQERVFRDGVEAVYARGAQELAARAEEIARWSRESLLAIGSAALRRSAEHTYRARAQTILDVVAGHGVGEGAHSTAAPRAEAPCAPART